MHPPSPVKPSKAQVVAELEFARSLLGGQIHLTRQELSPRVLVARSLRRHPWWWAGGGTLAAFLIVRAVLPSRAPKIQRDTQIDRVKKGWLLGLLTSPLMGLAQKALLSFAATRLQHYFHPAETSPLETQI